MFVFVEISRGVDLLLLVIAHGVEHENPEKADLPLNGGRGKSGNWMHRMRTVTDRFTADFRDRYFAYLLLRGNFEASHRDFRHGREGAKRSIHAAGFPPSCYWPIPGYKHRKNTFTPSLLSCDGSAACFEPTPSVAIRVWRSEKYKTVNGGLFSVIFLGLLS